MLVDTGSDSTVINPHDSRRLINREGWSQLRNPVDVRGAGAGIEHLPEPAVLHFRHEDGRVDKIQGPILIAQPHERNRALDSALGRDFLRHFSMHYDPRHDVVTLD